MPRVGIALGSNLGDRLHNIRAAISELRGVACPAEAFLEASIFATEPEFCTPGSSDFLNTVVEIGYHGSPEELLIQTRGIENLLGRHRGLERNAPRTIDLDLLYFDSEILSTPELLLPHPRIAERRFVLEPLAEIRPDLLLPHHSRTIREMLATLKAPSQVGV